MTRNEVIQKIDRRDTIAITIGLALFGVAAGAVCGLSAADGASTTLLTSMFTFVSGAILSYSAFKLPAVVKAKVAKAEADAEEAPAHGLRIGAGLSSVSVGLLLGVLLGMWARYTDPLGWASRHATSAHISESEGDGDVNGSGSAKGTKAGSGEGAESKAGGTQTTHAEFALHAGSAERQLCEEVKGRLDRKYYDDPATAPAAMLKEAVDDVRGLSKLCP